MKDNFNDCIVRLLKDEGGYTNNLADPGGPTNFGITLTDYRKYINPKGSADDVRKMRREDAIQIYRTKYWGALGCDSLSSGVDYTVFDYGVNSGLGRPRKALQRFKSLSGTELIDAINNERMSFLRGLSTFPTFGKGWTRRVEGVRAYSKQLASRNNIAGPITGVVAAAGAGASAVHPTVWAYLHSHPQVIGFAIVAIIGIGLAVHYILNKGK